MAVNDYTDLATLFNLFAVDAPVKASNHRLDAENVQALAEGPATGAPEVYGATRHLFYKATLGADNAFFNIQFGQFAGVQKFQIVVEGEVASINSGTTDSYIYPTVAGVRQGTGLLMHQNVFGAVGDKFVYESDVYNFSGSGVRPFLGKGFASLKPAIGDGFFDFEDNTARDFDGVEFELRNGGQFAAASAVYVYGYSRIFLDQAF